MKKVIVTTSINPVTKAIEKFQRLPDWELVVVGDKKTPQPYNLKRGVYMSCEMQENYDKELSDAIGWNCIQRRNFGLLWAYENKADIVALVDDDNIPYDGWGEHLMLGKESLAHYYATDLPVFDPIGATNFKNLWHRGYPLELVSQRDYRKKSKKKVTADIQADFWNGDPDIDAVCRMIYRPRCDFGARYFPISTNAFSPFNSQNTFLSRSVLKDYFLFPHVGRSDDVWASYYVEAKGYKVIYGKASVCQIRNEHDSIEDMKSEYMGYENNLKLAQALKADTENINRFLPEMSIRAFELYRKHYC